MSIVPHGGSPAMQLFQCPGCMRSHMRRELLTLQALTELEEKRKTDGRPTELDQKIRDMHYQEADEICPACGAVVISAADKALIDSGQPAKTSHLIDNRVEIR